MFKSITCPTCNHKWPVPEGTMGKRIHCENCQTPFIAGGSVATSTPPSPSQPGGFNKTMLGQQETLIRYKCPRCQKLLQSPAFEAGKKKPCPECGQRLQVPAAPPPKPAGIDKTMLAESQGGPQGGPQGLNKTMLTDAEQPVGGTNKTMLVSENQAPAAPPIRYNCPRCRIVIESQAHEAGTKKNCPSCGQRHKVPNASTLTGQGAMSGSGHGQQKPKGFWEEHFAGKPVKLAVVITCALVILFVVVPAVIRGGKIEDVQARKQAELDLAKLKAEIEAKQKAYDDELRKKKQWADLMAKLKQKEDALERQRELDRQNLILQQNEKLRQKREQERADDERKLKLEMEKMKLKLEQQQAEAAKIKLELQQQNQAKQKAATVVERPVYQYVPAYDWRYYRPYPWWY